MKKFKSENNDKFFIIVRYNGILSAPIIKIIKEMVPYCKIFGTKSLEDEGEFIIRHEDGTRNDILVNTGKYIVFYKNGDIEVYDKIENGQIYLFAPEMYSDILMATKFEQVGIIPIYLGAVSDNISWIQNLEKQWKQETIKQHSELTINSGNLLKEKRSIISNPEEYRSILESEKSFGEAFESVKKGKGMRLPTWEPDVVIRMAKTAKLSEYSPSKESVAYSMCTDVALAINRETTEKEDKAIRSAVQSRIHEQMTAPFLYVESRFGRVPWKETMIELFAENWEIVE